MYLCWNVAYYWHLFPHVNKMHVRNEPKIRHIQQLVDKQMGVLFKIKLSIINMCPTIISRMFAKKKIKIPDNKAI